VAREALDHHRIASMTSQKSRDLHRRRDEPALWHGPKTVIHGDTHIGNLFFDEGHGFLDWRHQASAPLLMSAISAFFVDRRPSHTRRELLRHYLDIWNSGSGTEITFDEAALPFDPRVQFARLSDRHLPAGHGGAGSSRAFLAIW
jgi:aminoglycoside phosphotransferase (APT) family kinase protein